LLLILEVSKMNKINIYTGVIITTDQVEAMMGNKTFWRSIDLRCHMSVIAEHKELDSEVTSLDYPTDYSEGLEQGVSNLESNSDDVGPVAKIFVCRSDST